MGVSFEFQLSPPSAWPDYVDCLTRNKQLGQNGNEKIKILDDSIAFSTCLIEFNLLL